MEEAVFRTLGCSELSGCGGGKATGQILVPSATWHQEQTHHFEVKPSEISTENSVYLQQCLCGTSELSTGVPPHIHPVRVVTSRVVNKQECFYPRSRHCLRVWGDDWRDFRIFRADGMSCFKAWGTLSTPERWGTSLSPSCQRRGAVPTPTFKQKPTVFIENLWELEFNKPRNVSLHFTVVQNHTETTCKKTWAS